MTIWSKSLAVVLAAILLLAGCATDTEPVDNTPTKTTVTTTSPMTTADDTDPSQTTTTGDNTTASTSNPSAGKTTGTKPTTRTTATTRVTPPTSPPVTIIKPVSIRVACMKDSILLDDTSMWGKRIAEELDAVEKEMNATFKFITYDSASLTEEFIKADKAGSKFADIVVSTMWQQRPLVKARVLADLNAVSGLNLTKSYFDQVARRDMQLYGKNFIAFTELDGPTADVSVIYFNKKLAKTAFEKLGVAVDSPDAAAKELYSYVDSGIWTFDRMQKISQKAAADLDGDGRMNAKSPSDQYGFSGVDMRGDVAYNIFRSKGGYFTKKSSNGDIVYALDDAINITSLKTMQTWLLKDVSVYNTAAYGTSPTAIIDAFKAGRVLFLGYSADAAFEFADMEDWGILPYPGPDTKSPNPVYTTASDWGAQGFCIPRKVKGWELTQAATAIDAIARRFQIIREEKNAYLAANVYSDDESARMVQETASLLAIDAVQFADLGVGGMSSIHYMFDKVSNDPAQRVKAVRNDAVKALNEYLKAVK